MGLRVQWVNQMPMHPGMCYSRIRADHDACCSETMFAAPEVFVGMDGANRQWVWDSVGCRTLLGRVSVI
eukprot:445748-Rhodomonas_salina.3